MPRLTFAILIASAFMLFPPVASAQDKPAAPSQGIWRFEKDAADAPSLSFVRDGKVIFLVRAGRTISLWIAYPGPQQPSGRAQVTIQASSRKFNLNGELTQEEQDGAQATYFVQRDMGMTERKKKWGNLTQRYNRFIEALTAAGEIVITTKAGVIKLPAVDIRDARQQMQL